MAHTSASGSLSSLSSSSLSSSALAFVDASVANPESLISQFQAGTEIHLLSPDRDAIEQITQILSSRSHVSAVHILSHGSSGALQLGDKTVDDLSDYRAELQLWSNSLNADADILLYGCNVAAGEAGVAFTNSLAQLTGADVTASDDLTGQGGDWQLEYQTGSIETASIAATDYSSTLANFTVTTLNDVVDPSDGVISLREAINAANALDGTDNIFFAVNGTITLGGSELTISSNLNIFGNGASLLTVSGNNASRVFDISSGTVTFSGLTIANGNGAGSNGGGINNAGTLNLLNCTVRNNLDSDGAFGFGGGIFNSGTLTITGGTIRDNRAFSSGGGVANTGTLTLTGCTVSDNVANDGNGLGGDGGGIANTGSLTVNSSSFSNNSAFIFGGGIVNSAGTVTVNGSTFTGNRAEFGGGIASAVTLTITSSTLRDNQAGFSGGGIWNVGMLTATSVLFTGNQAVNGAGLYTNDEAVVDFCTFTNNQADDEGGGIFAEGVLNLGNSYFQGNRATNSGGGLYLTGSDAKVSLSTFLSNSASEGGAIGLGVSGGTSTLLVTDSVLRFNSATTSGGGIFAGAGDQVTIRRSQVRQNSAPSGVDLFGAYISGGFNLIGKGGGFTGIVNGVNGDVILVP
ncbi:DUF4347 domain-containing protein [Leptolyngbya sp. NK1-12]|uniref:DUF4347 domain-containing protein n=1 Tax=Leptolyngbya sp. NK1-12 TaxID=2547451 RepID=A0AA96WH23_9CYAN|nr:DUF4347 domain-containing protein [Leptolyngbya sp. NK1-12]